MVASASKDFRQDINGLRAVAVLIVVFFHFGIPGFGGGFAGVDVFFVISGFLMTQIVVNGLQDETGKRKLGRFLVVFYLARARRIIPALLFFCLILLIFGWFYLNVPDYQDTARQIGRAVTFRSNIAFSQEAGYFGKNAQDQLLLHSWSLSVEWQFYLIFPVLLVIAKTLGASRGHFLGLLVILFLASFSFGLWEIMHSPLRAFYLLPSRSWELLAGGLVFFLPPVKNTALQRALAYGGLALIILSCVMLHGVERVWPGWWALLPVAGACLVLAAGQRCAFWSRSRLIQWVGNISYSLYLWHWPFAVVLGWLALNESAEFLLASLVAALLISHLSWRLIEQFWRVRLQKMSLMGSFIVLLVSTFLIVGCANLIKRNGVPARLPDHISVIMGEAWNTNPRMHECLVEGGKPVPECTYGGERLGAIVLGDSHAASIVRSVEKALPSKNLHVLDWTRVSCPTMLDIVSIEKGDDRSCSKFLAYALKKSKNLPEAPLIILNRSGGYFHGPNEAGREREVMKPHSYVGGPYRERSPNFYRNMQESMVSTACLFQETRQVYMMRPLPEMKLNVPATMARSAMFGLEKPVFISMAEYSERQRLTIQAQDEAARVCGVRILDPVHYFCRQGVCRGDKDGLPLYYDDDHLSENGGHLLLPLFRSIFSKP